MSQIQCGSGRDVLQVGLAQSTIACAPQTEGPHALGDRPLNPGALRVALFECLSRLVKPPRHKGRIRGHVAPL